MDSNFEQINQKAKYNDSVFGIGRLNEHWIAAERYVNSGNLIKWKFRLDSIWRELVPTVYQLMKTKPQEAKDLLSRNNLLKNKISQSRTQSQLYDSLNKRHEFLRIVQDKVGKGDVYVDEDEEGFE